MKVQPVEGRMLPLLKDPKRYVDREMDVPDHPYYRRALKRGDIAEASAPRAAKTKTSSKELDQ